MSERFERFLTFGAPLVSYNIPDTWTDEVGTLYKKLEAGDIGRGRPRGVRPGIGTWVDFIRSMQSKPKSAAQP